ncbi:MAG: 4Fe-4S cluster-binding domain-containing protein [Phycisphaerales bacterium]|nr:4Fe-4S cluster-binding domain-containing protein [Phycisphaerales bacterium]MCB9857071.1 4Fe-4S cluster-binding domain-containing protein [Phycisphaerales bacterium]MCB9861802.1 4Fe-4S cluster-binding domain-containing protein [Phycisphaerales bacterium]
MSKTYRVNEIFFSVQGEGMRVGTANLFLRFTGCNETCRIETHGFDCDTEFASGRDMTIDDIIAQLRETGPTCDWIVLTGGEPGLQVDRELIDALHAADFKLAIETNGSIELPAGIDWVTVSPKVAEHAIRQRTADEVKYVRGYGQGIPKTVVQAEYKLISPAFSGDQLDARTLDWCVMLVKENPDWRLSVQMHKAWRVR